MAKLLNFYLVSTLPTTIPGDSNINIGTMYFDKEDKSLHLLTAIATDGTPTFLRVQDTINYCVNPIVNHEGTNYLQLDNSNFTNLPIAEDSHFYINYTTSDSIVVGGVMIGSSYYPISSPIIIYKGTIGFIYGGTYVGTDSKTYAILYKVAEVKDKEYSNNYIDTNFIGKIGASDITGSLAYVAGISNQLNTSSAIQTIPSIEYLTKYLICKAAGAPNVNVSNRYILYVDTATDYLYYNKDGLGTWVLIKTNTTWA